MEKIKEMNFQEIMQLKHELEEMEKDWDWINEVMSDEEIKTLLKKE